MVTQWVTAAIIREDWFSPLSSTQLLYPCSAVKILCEELDSLLACVIFLSLCRPLSERVPLFLIDFELLSESNLFFVPDLGSAAFSEEKYIACPDFKVRKKKDCCTLLWLSHTVKITSWIVPPPKSLRIISMIQDKNRCCLHSFFY